MPTKPKKVRRPWEPKPQPKQAGRKADSSFYHTPAWRKLTKVYARAHPLCEECLKKGRTTPRAVTDHVTPIEQGGEPLSWNNLQSMCHPCHNRKSGRERHQKNENNE